MAAGKLDRWKARLDDLPQLALPTDYPRPSSDSMVEAREHRDLDSRTAGALFRLAMFVQEGTEDEDLSDSDDDDAPSAQPGKKDPRPTPFHLLLSAFIVLLHRYTGDADLIIATSSSSSPSPLLLRMKLDPTDTFWSLVKRVQFTEQEAEEDKVPYGELLKMLGRDSDAATRVDGQPPPAPLFRVRFIDETDETERGFLQSTSLTSDLTLLVSSAASAKDASSSTNGASTPTAASLRSSFLPSISLTASYNSLLFSSGRISSTLDQLFHVVNHASLHPLDPIGTISLLTSKQKKFLPDPRGDLEWTGFRGAITDIFSANAAKFPDRTCIVESLTPATDGAPNDIQTFTYKQMDEASNVLAHYLIGKGVKREDVVTVYSTRNADLVVAVMGILKAGATFSVIDPAYPPTRQTIYLQVAQPAALVILARAGQLLPHVRAYVEETLPNLVAEIPALQLLASGQVRGSTSGDSDGKGDLFEEAWKLASKPVGVPLGPDSVATLSFTSGSTGIPKGVRGRHFSLTHFFPWMKERFCLSEESKFTMLSGIAHDPIQRDIFTPLFLGAQLHIPTAEDIGTPGRLAEWMADSQVTVTHLTPAMGQLLSAQATRQIPTLKNAFFVGDILTKRDCTRLQQLANNVRIINMFGTTETQRAVSYFPIPPLSEEPTFLKTKKDIMPAGSGMINVQLLVVNRNDKNQICGVGEVGEIYVRSGGLAEGYLQLPDATAEKFVTNWFGEGITRTDSITDSKEPWAPYWKGVRDRMYRTGDLGRYGPDGMVECTGRADDQVKIRGFRIELGEIDTHLSRHPAVRENVTLVRRDKYEEKVLVSYFVPMFGSEQLDGLVSSAGEEDLAADGKDVNKGIKRYRRLIKDIRDYLKTKLPAYSIPTVFVPLSRMPLNPNGKVDKPALPFPDTATATKQPATSNSKLTTTEQAVHDIWMRLLPTPPADGAIEIDESFFDLGGHSILATRLVFEIRQTLAVGAPLSLVFDHPTIRGLAKEVDDLRSGDLGLANASNGAKDSKPAAVDTEYSDDAEKLIGELAPAYKAPGVAPKDGLTVFLTGATGFLGAYIVRDLATRKGVKKIICHIRAKSPEAALGRLQESGEARGAWDPSWVEKGVLSAVCGNLDSDNLGLSAEDYKTVSEEADVILHNGALVHWVYPYAKMRAANVVATVQAINLAATGKPKSLVFVSSTAAIEKAHYVRLADSIIQEGGRGVPESDPLDAGKTGLTTGYGQSKWVSERLILEAGRRGLAGAIVRPAYVVGDAATGVTNTDDFLTRLVKGCIQLGKSPDIHNTINMVPVDHVAKISALAAVSPATAALKVHHVTARPLPRFNDFLGSLAQYGYPVERIEYLSWRTELEQYVLKSQDNALFPLLHFVLDDLPTSTKAAELDDSNTVALLKAAGEPEATTIDTPTTGLYLAWLVAAGFLDAPTVKGGKVLALPALAQGFEAKAIGRSGH